MRLTLLLLAALATAPATGADAQTSRNRPVSGSHPDSLILAGDEAHTALHPGRALEAYQRILEAEPGRYDALWRSAREAVNLGMLATDGDERKARYEEAVGYARRARTANPDGIDGVEWLAVALGRLALDHGPRSRVRYAVEVRERALDALAIDSTSAGAHHVLGEWHAQVRRLSGVERWVARKLLGGSIMEEATWEDAEAHLRRAVELSPEGLVHHLDLARLYLDTNRPEEARVELREILERPAVEPADPLHKQAAQRLLLELGKRGSGGGAAQEPVRGIQRPATRACARATGMTRTDS